MNIPYRHPLLTSTRIIAAVMLLLSVIGCSSGNVQETTIPSEETVSPAQPPTSASTQEPTQTPTTVPTSEEPVSYINPQSYSVEYKVTFINDGFTPTDVRLYLPVPSEWDAQQDLTITGITPDPTAREIDPVNGNEMAYWQFSGTPASGEIADFTLTFEFTAYETVTYIDPDQVQAYQVEDPEYIQYTTAETYIESDDPDIMALASSLGDGETNPYLLAGKFYDYIIENVSYELLQQGLNGAKYILENKVGECGDYSALFIALCRASGIPARAVVGYWAVSGSDQTHVWAEFYLEGIGWIPVDVTMGQADASLQDYYFGNMDNQRVILSKGFNSLLVPAAPDDDVVPLLQCPCWWFWGNGDALLFTLERSWTVKGE